MEGELIRSRPTAKDRYTDGRKQDKHLTDWQANLRAKVISARKHFYRQVAIDLSYQYKTVIVAEIDWHVIVKNNQPEDDSEEVNKTYRALSACAILRDCLKEYMEVAQVSPRDITISCHACDKLMTPPGRGRWVNCERCGGEKIDRAENAARNLLKEYSNCLSASSAARET